MARLLCLPALLLAALIARGEPVDPPFRAGEVLEYELFWSFVPVGSAQLTVHGLEEIEGETAWHFSFEARTNAFADAFFKVRTRLDSWVSEDLRRTLYYREKKREGPTRRDAEIVFDWEEGTATYRNEGKAKEPLELPEAGVLDPVGAVYAFRAVRPGPEGAYPLRVTDGQKIVPLTVTVKGVEEERVPAGSFRTLVIEPATGSLGGVFEKSEDSAIFLWVQGGQSFAPVQVQGEVVVGSFWAKLRRLRPGPA